MLRSLVIGYGNPLRGDDGLGQQVALELDSGGLPVGAQAMALHQLTPELILDLKDVDRVVFVDASVAQPPGVVIEHGLEPVAAADGSFTHHVAPQTLLACTRLLYGVGPEATLITIGGECFDPGEPLSPPVAAALPAVIARVREILSE